MKQIDTIIIGATALALPLAYKLGESCLVVESSFSAGTEFVDAIAASVENTSTSRNGIAGELRDELLQKNIMSSDGRLHILALGGLLAGRYLETGCHLLLGSVLVSATQISGGFIVELFCPECGYLQYTAKRIIDTRVHDFMDCQKSFGLLLCGDNTLTEYDDGSAYLRQGRFDDEYILRLRIRRDASIPEAQTAADRYIAENRSHLGSAKVAGIALVFGYEFAAPLEITRDDVRYIPSASYPDLLSAIEGGERICL